EGWTNLTPVDLRAGTLVPIGLKVAGLSGTLSVRWMTAGVPWQVISGPSLYSRTALDRARTSYVRFLKAASLGAGLSITANEVAYLASNVDLRVAGQGWLNQLSAAGLPDVVTGSALSGVLSALLEFARIKAALSPADESFLAVLRNPDVTLGGGGSALLALTQWDQSSLSALLMHYFGDTKTAPLGRLEAFCRVYDAYAMVTTCGISASALVKPTNDMRRARQRDALVAFALHHLAERPATRSIDTPDRLFEYMLMDVEMAPCGQTSRVRLALSSIQLFIERALRSLEPEIDPTHISADQWEWMKRYRVWQANREVFLWPENWLDPEQLDDPSPIFKDTMGELLQGDITDDAATSALLNYLAKLHEVAKLEP